MANNNNNKSFDGSPVKSDEYNSLRHFDYPDAPPELLTPDQTEVNAELVPTKPSVAADQQPSPATTLPPGSPVPPPPPPPLSAVPPPPASLVPAVLPPPSQQPPIDQPGPSQPSEKTNTNQNAGNISWDIEFINDLLQRLGNEVDDNLGVDPESRSKTMTVPINPGEFDCDACYNMRDILHTDGLKNVRITLHGSQDAFDHLLIQIETFESDSVRLEHHILQLSSRSHAWTKWLLVIYMSFLKEDGVTIMLNTTSSFYELIESGGVNQGAPGPSNAAPQPPPQRPRARSRPRNVVPKTGLALQRERAGKLTNFDLSPYYKGPITLAARGLGLCSTAIKHACRRLGILRWPSRKLNSISRQIANHERELATLTDRDRIRDVLSMIEKLNAQYQRIMNGEPEQVEAGDEGGIGEEDDAGEEAEEGSDDEGKDGADGGAAAPST